MSGSIGGKSPERREADEAVQIPLPNKTMTPLQRTQQTSFSQRCDRIACFFLRASRCFLTISASQVRFATRLRMLLLIIMIHKDKMASGYLFSTSASAASLSARSFSFNISILSSNSLCIDYKQHLTIMRLNLW